MSKADEMLQYFKMHIGQWCCSTCACPTSGQPAAQFRECKKLGYKFEEITPGRWAKMMYCEQCGQDTPHYKLLSNKPVYEKKSRIAISPKTRKRVIELFDNRDAFTGGSITSTPEVDHKIPWTRMDKDVDANVLTESQIKEHFQLLTREHNLLKDRACGSCKQTNKRPPLFGIRFWYDGNENYCGTCKGCGWYDGVKWRKELNKLLV